jgi:hypothetical protein
MVSGMDEMFAPPCTPVRVMVPILTPVPGETTVVLGVVVTLTEPAVCAAADPAMKASETAENNTIFLIVIVCS